MAPESAVADLKARKPEVDRATRWAVQAMREPLPGLTHDETSVVVDDLGRSEEDRLWVRVLIGFGCALERETAGAPEVEGNTLVVRGVDDETARAIAAIARVKGGTVEGESL